MQAKRIRLVGCVAEAERDRADVFDDAVVALGAAAADPGVDALILTVSIVLPALSFAA